MEWRGKGGLRDKEQVLSVAELAEEWGWEEEETVAGMWLRAALCKGWSGVNP